MAATSATDIEVMQGNRLYVFSLKQGEWSKGVDVYVPPSTGGTKREEPAALKNRRDRLRPKRSLSMPALDRHRRDSAASSRSHQPDRRSSERQATCRTCVWIEKAVQPLQATAVADWRRNCPAVRRNSHTRLDSIATTLGGITHELGLKKPPLKWLRPWRHSGCLLGVIGGCSFSWTAIPTAI